MDTGIIYGWRYRWRCYHTSVSTHKPRCTSPLGVTSRLGAQIFVLNIMRISYVSSKGWLIPRLRQKTQDEKMTLDNLFVPEN